MPEIKKGESKADWMKRCVPVQIKEGKAQNQAVAICSSMFDQAGKKTEMDASSTTGLSDGAPHTPQFAPIYPPKKKHEFEKSIEDDNFQTVDLKGVEIFAVGKWKGLEFTEKDIEEAVTNFTNDVLGSEPYVTIDHNPKAGKQFSDALGAVALGFVDNLYKIGNKLMADFTKVPKTLANLINSGALKNKSVELWQDYDGKDGNKYNNVLEAVTFTGKIPAVAGLSDLLALYTKHEGQTANKDRGTARKITLFTVEERSKIHKEKLIMENENMVMVDKQRYSDLLKAEVERDLHKDNATKLTFTKDEFSKKIETLEKSNAELVKFKAETERKTAERISGQADGYINWAIGKGKIIPAQKDRYVKLYMTAFNEGKKSLAEFKEDLKSRGTVMNFGALRPETTGPVNKKDPAVKIDFTHMDSAKAHEAVEKHMKKYKVSYEEAAKTLGLAPPDEGEEDKHKAHQKVFDANMEAQKLSGEEGEGNGEEKIKPKDGEEPDGDEGEPAGDEPEDKE